MASSDCRVSQRGAFNDSHFQTFISCNRNQMKASTERKIIRWVHIILSIPLVGYIYGPVARIEGAAFMVKAVFFPIIVLSGFWLWKGHFIKRLFKNRWLNIFLFQSCPGNSAGYSLFWIIYLFRKSVIFNKSFTNRFESCPLVPAKKHIIIRLYAFFVLHLLRFIRTTNQTGTKTEQRRIHHCIC